MSSAIEISLNGSPTRIDQQTLAELIVRQNPEGAPLAAAVNGEFVPRSRHSETLLSHGDLVDLVSPVGGG